MNLTLFSFGFKHAPPEADTIIDVRFLPNPYYVPELSSGTGRDSEVAGYVLNNGEAEGFFARFIPFLLFFLQTHDKAGRPPHTLAVGCTGGRHRSVAVAEKLKDMMEQQGVTVALTHRDIERV